MSTLLSRLRAPSAAPVDDPPASSVFEPLPGCPWCAAVYRTSDLEQRTCWDGTIIACCPHCQRNVNDTAGAAEIRRIMGKMARDLNGGPGVSE